MPPRKRKVTYPVAKTSKHPAPADAGPEPELHPDQHRHRHDRRRGPDRPRDRGPGADHRHRALHGRGRGIVRFAGNVIPSALVKTEAGRTRQVRTIDLEPIAPDA